MGRGGTRSWALRRMRMQGRSGEDVWRERRHACAHALLNRPWITKEEEPELFYWIRDQYRELRDWFAEYAGFSLILTRSMAKLDKAPLRAYPWMGFQEFREPRDYTFFTYGLWFLEGKTELDQFLLKDMVVQIQEQMIGTGLHVDWEQYPHRLSMVRALKKLKQLGVLIAVDGDEQDWAHNDENNVLYECTPNVRYVLRQFPEELTRFTDIHELNAQMVYTDTADGEMRRRRHRVYRRLLLEPVILDKEWDSDDLYYVITQRRSLIEQLRTMFGWEGSRYREGLLFFHPDATSNGDLFPTMSAISDLVLLLAGELRRLQHAESTLWYVEENGEMILGRTDLENLLLVLRQRHKEYWSKEHQDMTAAELAEALARHMSEWGLGRWQNENLFAITPVLSRWNGIYQTEDPA
ncbi:TIGR02678 family protein [Brevibacillus borstelensis]|uniref:TIGR02678 family protein n=1 Tax=Brevibacillus borstelensis TaxID=45462 RepID=UPI0030BFAB3A